MTPLLVAAAVITGVCAAVVGATVGLGAGVAIGVLLGAASAGAVALRESRRVSDLAEALKRWSDDGAGGYRAVRGSGIGAWGRLERALNGLGRDRDRLLRVEARQPARRRELVESLAGPAMLFSRSGALIAANQAARRLFGLPSSEELTVVQALGSAVLAAAVQDAQQGNRPILQVAADVRDRYVVASVSVIDDDVLVIATDRTEERRVEDLRRNFVVNASHELKTPATAIQTLAEALEIAVEQNSPRVGSLVERLGVEAGRLGSMVHDLLNLRRLEEMGQVEGGDVDLSELIGEVTEELRPRAQAGGILLGVTHPERAPLEGSYDDLGLAFRNLIANAIQYNRRKGRVDVAVAAADGGWRVTIADTGIGIPQQDLTKVFERFYRVDVARSRETGGTGLGLSIVRHVIERHGGSIAVDSLLGDGTTFTVWLPRTRNSSMTATEG